MKLTMDRGTQQYRQNDLNLDLRLNRELGKPSLQQRILPPRTLRDLGSLLQSKNAHFSYSNEQKERALEDTRLRGTDLKALLGRVRTLKNYKQRTKEHKRNEQDCYFYFPEINIRNQDDYISRNIEFSMFNIVQGAMYNRDVQKKFTRKLINSLRKGHGFKSTYLGVPNIVSQVRQPERRNLYIRAVKDFINNFHIPTESRQLFTELYKINYISTFRNAVSARFWDILYGQTFNVGRGGSNGNPSSACTIFLIVSSLKLVENEYDQILPTSYDSISSYLSNMYLGKLAKQNQLDQKQLQRDPSWGVAYLLYRAGRRKDFYKVLANMRKFELLMQFQQYDRSVQQFRPQSSQSFWSEQNIDDVFYNQLVYILKGAAKFADSVICDPETLDIVWIILRTVGLYLDDPQNRERFHELRNNLFKNYLQTDVSETKISNMMYLLGYSELIDMCPNDYIDRDDFVHLLIALSNNPLLMRGSENKIRRKVTEQLVNYVNELINEKREQYIHYMVLIPEEHLALQVSSIIAYSQILDQISWKFLKERLPESLYTDLIHNTLEKQLTLHKSYILVADKYSELLKNKRQGLEVIIRMLITSIVQTKFPAKQLDKGQKMIARWFQEDHVLKQEFQPLTKLLLQTRSLSDNIANRRVNQIANTVVNSQLVIRNSKITGEIRVALEQLLKRQALEVYFYFLQYVIRGVQIIMQKKTADNIQALERASKDMLESVQTLLQQQECVEYANREIVVNLRNHLGSALYRGAY